MSASRKTICGLLCVSLYGASEQKHNRAKPLFESASALFSIADAGEFGSRGFILSEEVPLGHQKVSPISPVCRTCTRRIVQTWKRHGIWMPATARRNTRILLQRICRRSFILELFCSLVFCNITYPPKEVYAYCDNSMRQTDYIPVCSPAALICASDASAATSTS